MTIASARAAGPPTAQVAVNQTPTVREPSRTTWMRGTPLHPHRSARCFRSQVSTTSYGVCFNPACQSNLHGAPMCSEASCPIQPAQHSAVDRACLSCRDGTHVLKSSTWRTLANATAAFYGMDRSLLPEGIPRHLQVSYAAPLPMEHSDASQTHLSLVA